MDASRAEREEILKNKLDFNLLTDQVPSKGPMSGLLSAFLTHRDVAWLVVPCDLPLFSARNVKQLIDERDINAIATVFKSAKDPFPEPLIGIWESVAFPHIEAQFNEGNYSLANILNNNQICLVTALDPEGLTNVNTPEEKRAFSLEHPSVQF
jgi:molybdopterin-guanine dinucleotide biosynthesis protein A